MRYEITKSRPDGYYRYIRYDDNDSSVLRTYYNDRGDVYKIKFNVGWSLYSKQETEEEKKAWLDAVRKYNEDKQITGLAATLHSYIQDVRDFIALDDKNFPPNQDPIMPSLAALASIAEPEGKCDDEFLKKIHEMGLGGLPTPKEMFRYAYKAERFNVKNEINKQLYSFAKLGINGFVNPVLDMADNMVDTVFGTIDLVYTEIVRLCSRAYRLYKKAVALVKDQEERKKIMNMFLDELKKFGKDIYEFLYQALCIETFIELFKTLRNMWQTRQEVWKSLVAKLKSLIDFDYKSLGSEIINNLAGMIIGFLPLLGALLGAIFAKKCGDEEGVSAARKRMANDLSDGKTNNPDDIPDLVKNNAEKGKTKFKKASVVYNLCLDNKEDFSLYKKFKIELEENTNNTLDSSTNDNENNVNCNCKVSMCDYETPTDLDYFPNENALFPELLTIEFDKSFKYSINVSVGQIIRVYDIIGYVSGIPVKAKFDFKVLEVKDNYIVGEYYFDLNTDEDNLDQRLVEYANNRINTHDTGEFEKLQSNFSDIASVEDFIMNYAPYCRIPDLALNSGSYLFGKTIGNCIDDYYEFLDDERQNQAEELKIVAGKDNVYRRGNAGEMYTLKEEIDNAKSKMLNRFINISLSPNGGANIKCKSRIADYCLYSYYLDYLYSDRFMYNEDNKFIVKLHNLISGFIAERTRIELGNENISALIVDFNDTCHKYLSPYWKFNNQSYYQTFSSLFTSDYYEQNTEKIIPKTTSKDSFTLYNRVYMYLTSLTSFTPTESQNKITINENTDVNALMNNLSKMSDDSAINKDDEKTKTNLRRIALKFVTLRKVEQNMKNGFVTSFMNENKIAIQRLNGGINPIPITDYYEGEVLMMGEIPLNRGAYLGSYLTMLKKTTLAESRKLQQLINEAINWYLAHRNDNENIIELFKPLMQMNWPASSIIYKNNVKCNFFLFSPVMGVTPPPTTMKELKELERKNKDSSNDPNSMNNVGAYPSTANGLDTIQYWLRYCGIASAVHCMLPMFWSTGLIIPPIPYIMMPVIYIPFYVLSGRVTIVFGLGLCGIMPSPMILFVNLGTLLGSIIIPINMVVDMLIDMTKKLSNIETVTIDGMLSPMIATLDKQIRELEIEKEDIPYQIDQIKTLQIKGKKKVLDTINSVQGNDLTFKAELNAAEENLIIQEESSFVEDTDDDINKAEKELNELVEATNSTPSKSYAEAMLEALNETAEDKKKEAQEYKASHPEETLTFTQVDRNIAASTGSITIQQSEFVDYNGPADGTIGSKAFPQGKGKAMLPRGTYYPFYTFGIGASPKARPEKAYAQRSGVECCKLIINVISDYPKYGCKTIGDIICRYHTGRPTYEEFLKYYGARAGINDIADGRFVSSQEMVVRQNRYQQHLVDYVHMSNKTPFAMTYKVLYPLITFFSRQEQGVNSEEACKIALKEMRIT